MLRRALLPVVFRALLVVAFAGLVHEARAAGGVIPPGREPLVLQMVCERSGAPLPGGCVCDGVSIDHSFIRAKYACPGSGAAVVELRQLSEAENARDKTAQFAIVPRGAVPDPLLRDLVSRVRAAEGAWAWAQPAAGPGAPSGGGPAGRFPLIVSLLAVAALSVTWWARSTLPSRES